VLAIVLLAKREITDICQYQVFASVLAAHDGYKVIGLAGAKARVIGYFCPSVNEPDADRLSLPLHSLTHATPSLSHHCGLPRESASLGGQANSDTHGSEQSNRMVYRFGAVE
jgi:hypothetical protein